MKNQKLCYIIFLLGVAMSLLIGCASDTAQTGSEPERVSTIPWNRPQKWEGQGQLGGMMNQ